MQDGSFKGPDVPEPQDDRPSQEERGPAARGIALCLGKLADEAAELGLGDTNLAIRRAIGACLLETAGRELLESCNLH